MRIGIVGLGLAGLRVVAALREDFDGDIVAWTDEAEPYDRPPLSKELFGHFRQPLSELGLGDTSCVDLRVERVKTVLPAPAETSSMTAHPGSARQNTPLADIGSAGWLINGTHVDAAVIAVGAQPITTIPNALTLYTISDAETLASRLTPGRTLHVVGAGWVGTEIASAAAGRCKVHVWEATGNILGRTFGAAVTPLWAEWMNDAGVSLHLGKKFPGANTGDVILQATGARCDLAFLTDAVSRNERGALTTDATTRVIGTANLYAVGDCGDGAIPGGHWNKALHDGAFTAAAILGTAAPGFRQPAEIFSTQFGHEITMVGAAEGDCEFDSANRTLRWGKDDLRGLLAVDNPRAVSKARKALRIR